MRPRSDSLVAFVGSACTYGCPTCPIPDRAANSTVPLDAIGALLGRSQPIANRLVVVVGGEPFLNRDLPRLFTLIRSLGGRPGVVCTGRPLLYPQVRAVLERTGVAYVRVQLFGRAEVHDAHVAVAGSYAQTIEAVRTWLATKPVESDVDVVLNLHADPPQTLVADLEGIASDVGVGDWNLIVHLPSGVTGAPLRSAAATLATWNEDSGKPLLSWENLPDEIEGDGFFRIPALTPTPSDAERPIASCLGSPTDMAGDSKRHGQVRANSFNFLAAEDYLPASVDADTCAVPSTTLAGSPHRSLWLELDGRLQRFATDTGDFALEEIAAVKVQLSHLLLDRAQPGVLDDFTDGMRRVRPAPICTSCARRVDCAGRYRVVEGPPFAVEERWIRDYIASLGGSVLDVGCGEQLYREILAPLIASQRISYIGLDPDAASLASARGALPEARFVRGDIETYRVEPGRYDHILCLRALNHVFDLDEGIGRMAEMLAPGGQLLLVETTPFAMLRRPEQVVAADLAPRAGHQHFRNVTSVEVVPYARRRSLRVVEHRAVALETSNEWILLLERPREA